MDIPTSFPNEYVGWDPPRTAEAAFLALPPGYNGLAIENMKQGQEELGINKNELFTSLASAIINSFSWEQTPQGHSFWEQIYYCYQYPNPKNKLPPLPETGE